MATLKKKRKILHVGKNVERMTFSYTVDGSVNCLPTWKNSLVVFISVKIVMPQNIAILHKDRYIPSRNAYIHAA